MDRKMDTTGEIKPLSRKVQRDAKPRHNKRFSLALLSLLLISALAGLYHLPSTAAEVGDTIYISTQAELEQIAEAVNVGSNDYQNKTIILSNDIALSGDWTPIGKEAKSFKGVFDGQGHTISGLYINSADATLQGLFGYICGPTAEVKNLTVFGNVLGNRNVGLIAGANESGKITNCVASGTVSGDHDVGAVVGTNITSGDNVTATVANCTAASAITNGTNCIGGVVGYNAANGSGNTAVVENCVASSATVRGIENIGGVVGQNVASGDNTTATVANCEVSGTITGTAISYTYYTGIGGIVGSSLADGNGSTATVANCAVNGAAISGDTVNGGIGGIAGGSFAYSNRSMVVVENCVVSGTTVRGTNTVGGNVGANEANDDGSMATVANCMVSAATVSGTNTVGGSVGLSSSAENSTATVTNCVADKATVNGTFIVGGVVGVNKANDDGSTATVTNCVATGVATASGDTNVGGVVGYNFVSNGTATVTNCTSRVTTVSGDTNVGGVVGYNLVSSGTATVTNCGWLGTSATNGIGENDGGTSADVVSYDASAKIVVACLPDTISLRLTTERSADITLRTYPFETASFDKYVTSVDASVSPDIASATPSGNRITVTAKTTPGAAAVATSFRITPTWFHGNCDATSPDAYSAKLSPKVALVVKAGTQPKPQPQPSSSGGCNAGLGALAMLALIPVTLKKKR